MTPLPCAIVVMLSYAVLGGVAHGEAEGLVFFQGGARGNTVARIGIEQPIPVRELCLAVASLEDGRIAPLLESEIISVVCVIHILADRCAAVHVAAHVGIFHLAVALRAGAVHHGLGGHGLPFACLTLMYLEHGLTVDAARGRGEELAARVVEFHIEVPLAVIGEGA